MRCLNCGKETNDDWSFQRHGRIIIGYDCTCGYTSYENYMEETPPVVDCFDDIIKALKERKSCKKVHVNNMGVEFATDDYEGFITEVFSQIDFNVSFILIKEGNHTSGMFIRLEKNEKA